MQWLFHAHLWEEKQLRQDFLELKKFVLKLAPGASFSQGLLPRGPLGRWQGRDRLAGPPGRPGHRHAQVWQYCLLVGACRQADAPFPRSEGLSSGYFRRGRGELENLMTELGCLPWGWEGGMIFTASPPTGLALGWADRWAPMGSGHWEGSSRQWVTGLGARP